jgi:DNA repair exonuclease SbcCD ATPase subunit
MSDSKPKVDEQATELVEPAEVESVIQEVAEIKEAVTGFVTETSLSDKVEQLRTNLDNLSEEVESWRSWPKDTYLEVLETLKAQVEEIQNEWNNVAGSMQTQRERLESLLQSFPGVIETSAIKALSLRMTHLEQLVSEVFHESQARATTNRARKQLIISLAALGVTVILWGAFLVLNALK